MNPIFTGPLDHLLYVDEDRIDDYLQRLGVATEASEKSRKIEAEFSLSGPKVKFSQDETPRKLDVHERIKRLEEALARSALLALSRPVTRFANVEYVLEEFFGYRVAIPSTAEKDRTLPAFSFWLCPGDGDKGLLCLLENCRVDDDAPYDFSRCSTYTVLQSLVHFARERVNASVLAISLPQLPHPNQHAKIDDTHPASLFYEYYSVENYLYEFMTNPIPLLKRWGAIISPLKAVRGLYRVREYGPESAHG